MAEDLGHLSDATLLQVGTGLSRPSFKYLRTRARLGCVGADRARETAIKGGRVRPCLRNFSHLWPRAGSRLGHAARSSEGDRRRGMSLMILADVDVTWCSAELCF